MRDVQINYLPDRRESFFNLSCFVLDAMKEQNKERITINILTHGNPARWDKYTKRLKASGFATYVKTFPDNSYLQKINTELYERCQEKV